MPTISECVEALDFSESEIKEIINNYNNIISFETPLKDEKESDTIGMLIKEETTSSAINIASTTSCLIILFFI